MTSLEGIENLDSEATQLVALTLQAQKMAHAPYSRFYVGCALVDDRGKFFTGCNVENASYSLTTDAERTAIVKMVSDGGRFCRRIVLITSSEIPVWPCGSCRQILSEFSDETEIIALSGDGKKFSKALLSELLPTPIKQSQVERA